MNVRTWRKVHRHLGLVIGVQLLLWTSSGLIFSWSSIQSVRGEHMIRANSSIDLTTLSLKNHNEILRAISLGFPDDSAVVSILLRTMAGRPVYEVKFERHNEHFFALVDAATGNKISPIGVDTAKRVAQNDFADDVEVRSVEWIESVGAHSEYRGKELPAYRVVLEHPSDTAIYVSANRGVVTTRRNKQWRRFDFFWMLHTMDYQGRDNFNHWLLKTFSIFGLATVLSGFFLWFKSSRFSRKRKKRVSG